MGPFNPELALLVPRSDLEGESGRGPALMSPAPLGAPALLLNHLLTKPHLEPAEPVAPGEEDGSPSAGTVIGEAEVDAGRDGDGDDAWGTRVGVLGASERTLLAAGALVVVPASAPAADTCSHQ